MAISEKELENEIEIHEIVRNVLEYKLLKWIRFNTNKFISSSLKFFDDNKNFDDNNKMMTF